MGKMDEKNATSANSDNIGNMEDIEKSAVDNAAGNASGQAEKTAAKETDAGMDTGGTNVQDAQDAGSGGTCGENGDENAEVFGTGSKKKREKELEKEIVQLKKDNERLAKGIEELDDRLRRVAAEYDNYRKRTAKERETVYVDACSDVLKEIFPVIDNLERALSFGGDPESDKLTGGVVMTLNQFCSALERLGVQAVGAKGEKFNPELHNAIMHIEEEGVGENEIVEVFQKGYQRGDKVLRYAMVKVVN